MMLTTEKGGDVVRKKRDGISFAVFCAALLIGSLLAGCTTALEPQETQPTEPAYSTETPTAAEKTQPARSEDDLAEVSLASFRQAMVGTPQLFGVAYFGDTTQALDQPVNPFSVMQEAAPQLCEDLPFLLAVPEGNVVGISGQL